jgi:hypothetical protein
VPTAKLDKRSQIELRPDSRKHKHDKRSEILVGQILHWLKLMQKLVKHAPQNQRQHQQSFTPFHQYQKPLRLISDFLPPGKSVLVMFVLYEIK